MGIVVPLEKDSACLVSQYLQRSEHPARRTIVHGIPASVLSPWIES